MRCHARNCHLFPWDREGAHACGGLRDSGGEDTRPEHGTLLRAVTPVRMMWEFSTWMTRWPSLTRYAPIPMARQVTWAHTQGHVELLGRKGCSTVRERQENDGPQLHSSYTRSLAVVPPMVTLK